MLCHNHTWCLHDSDIPDGAQAWFRPLIAHSWSTHKVYFPKYERSFSKAYHALTSEHLRQKTMDLKTCQIQLKTLVQAISQGEVGPRIFKIETTGPDGRKTYHAHKIFDCRGWASLEKAPGGFQKFLGLEIEFENGHGVTEAILKDARVQQIDGYRFFYVLPLSEKTLLVEDTYYSLNPKLNQEAIRDRIMDYAKSHFGGSFRILRTETGCLPIPTNPPNFKPIPFLTPDGNGDPPNQIQTMGATGRSFHPVTGYTLPSILKQLCSIKSNTSPKFLNLLNRMLFYAGKEDERYKVLEKFYLLPEETIFRFYGGSLRPQDWFRILSGRPPVPVLSAIRSLFRN